MWRLEGGRHGRPAKVILSRLFKSKWMVSRPFGLIIDVDPEIVVRVRLSIGVRPLLRKRYEPPVPFEVKSCIGCLVSFQPLVVLDRDRLGNIDRLEGRKIGPARPGDLATAKCED